MKIFPKKQKPEDRIQTPGLRELVLNIKMDLVNFYPDGKLDVEFFPPSRDLPQSKSTVSISNIVQGGWFKVTPEVNCVFAINDGTTGANYVAARYLGEETREIIERRLGEYAKSRGLGYKLERFSDI